ncbi:hypothetical protein FO519_008055 [Halicephalobus sp. NKZ332]|nr:hypothetical protein FO519_008055 [Halicephalobus sp. NKZ332]
MLYVPSYFTSNKIYTTEKKFGEVIQSDRIHAAGGALLEARIDSIENEKRRPNPKIIQSKGDKEENFVFSVEYRGKKLFIESILTHPDAEPLEARVVLDPKMIKSTKKIMALDGGFTKFNLGGCPDWNCELVSGGNIEEADVAIMQARNKLSRKPNHLFVFYSQESPQNSARLGDTGSYFNMTFGFRHDSPAASPYGYTVKLAEKSRIPPGTPVIDVNLVKNKSKGASWFVSHCGTHSRREELVKSLQSFVQVDIYGACGSMRCNKGTSCENSIDEDYHFYMALENSICQDYITEKLWNQGYTHTVIPIVLKRSIIEPYAPPNSFIAFDDYKTIEEMANHLKLLMENELEYLKYFEWKRDYAVIYLDGKNHDALERPWGFCQLCRLAHILDYDPTVASKMKLLSNENLGKKWDDSCEAVGSLASQILGQSPPNQNAQNKNLPKSDTLPPNQKRVLGESEMRVMP